MGELGFIHQSARKLKWTIFLRVLKSLTLLFPIKVLVCFPSKTTNLKIYRFIVIHQVFSGIQCCPESFTMQMIYPLAVKTNSCAHFQTV